MSKSLISTPISTPDNTLVRPAIRWGWLRALLFVPGWLMAEISFSLALYLGILGVIAVSGADRSLLDALFPDAGSGGEIELSRMLLAQVVSMAAIIFAVRLFRRLIDNDTVASLGFVLSGFGGHFAIGLFMGALAIGAGFLALMGMGLLEIVPRSSSIDWGEIVAGFALFCTVAISEEVVMRGYILTNLGKSVHPFLAVAISSVFFGVVHLFNFNLSVLGIANIALAGVVFGVYYVRFRNLWFPMGLHLTWNFFQGPVFGFGVSGFATESIINHTTSGPEWLSGGKFGLEGSVITTVLEVLMIVGILLWGRSSSRCDQSKSYST